MDRETELTEAIGSIHRKEKHTQTNALGDRKSAFYQVGLLDGNIIQGRKRILSAESMCRADCRHGFLCEGSAFGNMFKREPETE